MGQRDGFAPSDLAKINKMYSCDNKPGSSISGIGSFTRPTFQRPNRPFAGGNSGNAGNGNGAQLFGALLGGIGSIISSFGHDDTNHI